MNLLEQYEKFCESTAVYPKDIEIFYLTLGLSGEAGELSNKVKKVYRDKEGIFNNETKEELLSELGDVLWYLTRLSNALGYSLENVIGDNVNKLSNRKKKGTLKGSGDNR